jgi:phenylalanyl-tRNA synthetase beta chain
MRVPIAWLRDYVDLPDDAQAIADRLAMLGFPVDGIDVRPVITGVVAGRIAKLDKHPNADRLQVGSIDVGAATPLVIATAATNVAIGQTIPVAVIGAQLPQIKIERRKMRGLESEGMMCSAEELALPPEWFEDGIMQLDASIAPGTDIVAAFRLSDAVLDVDVTSNRPDALSMIGLARELAAAAGAPLHLPSFENPGTQADPAGTAPTVTLESPDCTRFVAQRFDGVRVGDAPAWMRVRLALAGQRPINNLVDVSNYTMIETGQPLHFYDDAKIADHALIVRDARAGEPFTALDGVEYELTPQALVIADANGAQCLAGLKGGKASEVGPATTSIILEAANFAGGRIRRTSARLGLRTDASSRHEKTLAPALTDIGAARAAQLLVSLGANAYAPHAFGDALEPADPIAFDITNVKRLLGFDLSLDAVTRHLQALGCSVAPQGGSIVDVLAPPWRRDLRVAADIVEEIARMEGYENVVAEMPPTLPQAVESRAFRLERRLAHVLVRLGYSEIVSYALHGPGMLEKLRAGGIVLKAPPVEIRNPLSEDQRYLRYAIGPGITEYFARYDRPIRAFELGHIFTYRDSVVTEESVVGFGFTAEPTDEPEWSDKNLLRLIGDARALVRSVTGRTPETAADTRPGLHPGKTAVLLLDGREVASLGRVHPQLAKAFDVARPAYLANIYLDALPDYVAPHYVPPSRFPSTYRDLALIVAADVTADRISSAAAKAAGELCTGARAFDEYRSEQIGNDRKSLALRITLQRRDATITDEEADAVIARVLDALRDELDAVIRT